MASQDMMNNPMTTKDTRGLIHSEQQPHYDAPQYDAQQGNQGQHPMWYNDQATHFNANVLPPPYPGTQGGLPPSHHQMAPPGYPMATQGIQAPPRTQTNVVVVRDTASADAMRNWDNYWKARCICISVFVTIKLIVLVVVLTVIYQ